MKVMAKIKLKDIPTEKLVAELIRRDNVLTYACDPYRGDYCVHIDDCRGNNPQRVPVPGNCDVIIIERSAH